MDSSTLTSVSVPQVLSVCSIPEQNILIEYSNYRVLPTTPVVPNIPHPTLPHCPWLDTAREMSWVGGGCFQEEGRGLFLRAPRGWGASFRGAGGLVEPWGELSSEPDATYLVQPLIVSQLRGRLCVFWILVFLINPQILKLKISLLILSKYSNLIWWEHIASMILEKFTVDARHIRSFITAQSASLYCG